MHRERVITAFPDSQVHISKVMRFNLRKIEANKASQNAIVLAYSSSWRNPVACSSSSHLISDRAIYISVSPLATYRHFQSADLERANAHSLACPPSIASSQNTNSMRKTPRSDP
jgi:hypothetical protein